MGRLRRAPRAVSRRVVRRLALDAGGRAAVPEASHVERALELLDGEGDRQVELRAGLVARRRGGKLEVVRSQGRRGAPGRPAAPMPPVLIAGPGRCRLPGPRRMLLVEVAPGFDVAWPLTARTRRAGDRFRPAGGRGGKTLKAWLIDRKVARDRRDELVLIVDGSGRVLAIPELGVRAEGADWLDVTMTSAR